MNGILIHSGDRPWVTIVRVRGRCPVTPIEAGGGQWSPSGQCPPCVRVAVLLRHSPLITNIHHKHQRPEHKQQLSLYWKPVKKRNEKCLKEVWWRKALLDARLAPRVGVRGGCHCVTPGPSAGGRCCGRGLRTARPPLAAEDRLRLVAVRCAVPALWSAAALAAHSTCIWCICRLGCTVSHSTDYTRTRTGFFTGWLSARCWTLDTGLGLELGMSTDNTQATPDAVLSPATLTTHHIIYHHIMLSSPTYFLCVEPYPIKFLTLTLCVLSNTLKALKYTANCSPLSAARGLQDAANVRLPRIWSPRYFIFNEFAINVRAGITVIMYLKIWTKIIYVHCLLKLKFVEASLKGNLIWREKSLRRTKPCLSFNLAKESKVREIIRK